MHSRLDQIKKFQTLKTLFTESAVLLVFILIIPLAVYVFNMIFSYGTAHIPQEMLEKML